MARIQHTKRRGRRGAEGKVGELFELKVGETFTRPSAYTCANTTRDS